MCGAVFVEVHRGQLTVHILRMDRDNVGNKAFDISLLIGCQAGVYEFLPKRSPVSLKSIKNIVDP